MEVHPFYFRRNKFVVQHRLQIRKNLNKRIEIIMIM